MDQQEKPPLTHQLQHPAEEEEHHETGASKMFRKVKAGARKFKNSITKHGQSHEQDHDVVEDDDEDDDELEPEVIGGATGKPESLSHPRETNVPAPEEIVPPGTKAFPVVSSGHSNPIEPVQLQETSYGHDAPAHSVRTDKEERRDAPIHLPLSDREESREAHHESLNTHVPLFSGTEDVTKTSTPGGEGEYLDGQRKVNVESPKKLEETAAAPGGGSGYLTNPTHDELVESLERMEVTDESTGQKSRPGFEREMSTSSKEFREFDQDFKSVLSDSPVRHEGESEAELGKDFQTRSQDSDMKTEAGFDKDSPSRSHDFDMKTESGMDKNSPSRSHEFDMKSESGTYKNSPVGAKPEAELEESFPTGSREFDQSFGSGKNEYSPTESDVGLGAPMGGNFPVRSSEKNESGLDKETPTGFDGEPDFLAKGRPGYGEEPEEENFTARNDDVKVEAGLGRDLPMGTHAESSPELSRPKERDVFLETRDSFDETTQETKPTTYTEHFTTATSALSNQAVAAKNAVTSKLGYTGETPVGDKTQVAGSVDEKLTPVNEKDRETESTASKTLPLSGGGSGMEEKLTPEEEDKAFSEMVADKHQIGGGEKKATTTKVEVENIPTEKISEEKEHGEVDAEEVKEGGGMVGMIKGWFGGAATEEVKPKSPHSVDESPQPRGWFGGAATEEVKPKSPHSVDDSSSQSIGTTVGTKGFSDTSGGVLGETDGAVPVKRGL